MKYSLRSLMIVVAVAPPLLAASWFLFPIYRQVWVVNLVIAAWCGVVFMASGFAYLRKKNPAMLVAAILAIFALLGWVALDLVLSNMVRSP